MLANSQNGSSLENTALLFEQRQFYLEHGYQDIINAIFECDVILEDGKYCINTANSAKFRWLVVSYLNNLEAIMMAWLNEVADQKIIEDQFSFLIMPRKGSFILEKYREVADGPSNYPGITAFEQHLKDKSIA